MADYQFDEIQLYDYTVAFQDPQTEQSAAAYLTASGWAEEDGKLIHSGSIDVLHGGVSKSVFLVIPADGQLDRFVSLHSGGEALPCPGVDEVVINIGLAENMGISLGEVIQLRDEDYGTLEVTVSGIADNYVQNYIYLSRETYRKQYDEEPEYNGLYVLGHEGADPYEEGALLLEDDGVSNVAINQATRDQVDSMLSRLDYIVIVVVACAGALRNIDVGQVVQHDERQRPRAGHHHNDDVVQPGERSEKNHGNIHDQRPSRHAAPEYEAPAAPPGRAGPDGGQGRVQRGGLRRVHGAHWRPALPGLRAGHGHAGGASDPHHRGPDGLGEAGLHLRLRGGRGGAVRLLHPRHGPVQQGAAGPEPGPHRAGDPVRPAQQLLPLYRLCEDRGGGAAGR